MAKNPETDLYFYHPDHLGSGSWITDVNGNFIFNSGIGCVFKQEILVLLKNSGH